MFGKEGPESLAKTTPHDARQTTLPGMAAEFDLKFTI
jgi:hypothetical protein